LDSGKEELPNLSTGTKVKPLETLGDCLGKAFGEGASGRPVFWGDGRRVKVTLGGTKQENM